MTLELKLKIRKTDLRYQEDTLTEVTLVHRGTASLTLVDLRRGTAGLRWRVIDVKTGAENVYARPRPANCFSPEPESPMNAGETRSAITRRADGGGAERKD